MQALRASAARQDDKPVPPCYQPAMEWIIAIALAVGVFVLVAIVVLRVKHRPGSVHGDFRFDSHKTGELSKRGLFDKTKW